MAGAPCQDFCTIARKVYLQVEGTYNLSILTDTVAEVAFKWTTCCLANKMTTDGMWRSRVHLTVFNLVKPNLTYLFNFVRNKWSITWLHIKERTLKKWLLLTSDKRGKRLYRTSSMGHMDSSWGTRTYMLCILVDRSERHDNLWRQDEFSNPGKQLRLIQDAPTSSSNHSTSRLPSKIIHYAIKCPKYIINLRESGPLWSDKN